MEDGGGGGGNKCEFFQIHIYIYDDGQSVGRKKLKFWSCPKRGDRVLTEGDNGQESDICSGSLDSSNNTIVLEKKIMFQVSAYLSEDDLYFYLLLFLI